MSTPEFGRILDKPTETEEFGRILKEDPIKKSTLKKVVRAAGRGGIKAATGIAELSQMLTAPGLSFLQESPYEDLLERLLPQDPEAGFAEKTIERGIEMLPLLLGGEGALLSRAAPALGRSALSALLGQTAEELGGGESTQTAAEIAGLGLPGLRKKIVPKKAQKAAVEMLRRRGLKEKEIAPLIPSERKGALLGKIGVRGFRTEKAAKRTRTSLSNLYSQLAEEGEKLPILSSNRASLLQSQLAEKLEKMPTSVRRSINEDLNDLFKKPVKANDLMNFWQDINSQINWNKIGGGKKKLNSLKNILLDGMKDINPQLSRDFELANKQYIKFNKLYKNLKPESLDRWMALGELGVLIGGFFKFGPKAAIGVIGTDLARRFSTEMLINPRLQNLSSQMVKALNQNKISIARKIQSKMEKELKKKAIDIE